MQIWLVSVARNLLTSTRKVNISNLSISADYIILNKDYSPTAWTGLIFISDILRNKWGDGDLRPLFNNYIISQLRNLKGLQTFIANNTVGMSTSMAKDLVDGCPSLQFVDFRKSSMRKQQPWAIEGTRAEVKVILRQMDEDARFASKSGVAT